MLGSGNKCLGSLAPRGNFRKTVSPTSKTLAAGLFWFACIWRRSAASCVQRVNKLQVFRKFAKSLAATSVSGSPDGTTNGAKRLSTGEAMAYPAVMS